MPKLTCKDLIGRWSISRLICDNLTHSIRTFCGQAIIKQDNLHFHYQEKGDLMLSKNISFSAEQSYIWKPISNSIFDIFFKNGNFFCTLDLKLANQRGVCSAKHLCEADLYVVDYDFSKFPVWSSLWTVSGPKKDYQIVSDFRYLSHE